MNVKIGHRFLHQGVALVALRRAFHHAHQVLVAADAPSPPYHRGNGRSLRLSCCRQDGRVHRGRSRRLLLVLLERWLLLVVVVVKIENRADDCSLDVML
jgi:hypothetical protein